MQALEGPSVGATRQVFLRCRARRIGLVTALAVSFSVTTEAGTGRAATSPPVVLREALVLEPVGRAGRNTLFTDAVEARLVAGTWRPPEVGQSEHGPTDRTTRAWKSASANEEGWFTGREMRGGWAYFRHASPETRIVLLQAAGHSMAYVNGDPKAGDIYGHGYVSLPVLLEAGANDFLVASGRGRLRIQLSEPKTPISWQSADTTLPDLLVGEKTDTWGAAVLINATTNWLRGAWVRVEISGRSTETETGSVPPLGVRKVGFRMRAPAPRTEGTITARVVLGSNEGGSEIGDALRLELRVRRPDQVHKRTFVSAIDGSVQYYAVNPGLPSADGRGAMVLSLHGASVEALGQAEAYGTKRWGTLVAPTNRRPYGFDWEEWGRIDALEVLGIAKERFRPDQDRIYLTGHSMGGHGTWNLGVTFPDRFAAIGPSAGWISFFSYAGTNPFTNATPVEAILRRAAASSDTLALATNYLHHGVYILHGDADDNVPVREARRMREVLETFHRDFAWHEQPGAGHWWGNSDEPGSECVDWPPMFDFFARHRIPAGTEARRVHFVTVNPGVNARSRWLAVEAQERAMIPSEIDARWDPGSRRVVATTRNVLRLAMDVGDFGPAPDGFQVILDGTEFDGVRPERIVRTTKKRSRDASSPGNGTLRFERSGQGWSVSGPMSAARKGPHRAGPFKDAFRHRMVFVYGTVGTPEETAWALAKASFDAESFWYRGNGSVDVVSDRELEGDRVRFADRGIIVYGHAEMNAAWQTLLSNSPVQVRRGEVRVGGRRVARDDAACLFIQPRPDSDVASVGVVAGSGMAGLRLARRLPYFMAGTGYPDCLVIGAEALEKGTGGIVTAGFFGDDWSVDRGEFAWQAE